MYAYKHLHPFSSFHKSTHFFEFLAKGLKRKTGTGGVDLETGNSSEESASQHDITKDSRKASTRTYKTKRRRKVLGNEAYGTIHL